MLQVFKNLPKDNSTPESDTLICASKEIFDQQALKKTVDDLAFSAKSGADLRRELARLLGQANKDGRAAISTYYRKDPFRTREAIRSYTFLTDQIVKLTFYTATKWIHPQANPTVSERLALLAVGGYGRAEMAPFSDVDLLFLAPYKLTPWAESVIETMLYTLWDIKLKVGHASRTVDECLRLGKNDLTIRTALLENRFLGGDPELALTLDDRLWSELFKGTGAEFVELKLEERAARHKRQGGQRYMVEPNVKEGKGGLRDLQTLFWITKYLSHAKSSEDMIKQGFFTKTEYERFAQAEHFLWTVRCHLHLITNRATEQLTFDTQVEVAKALGFEDQEGLRAVEKFMQIYFRHATHVGELTRIFLTALEAQHVKRQPGFGHKFMRALSLRRDPTAAGYKLVHGRLAIANDVKFLSDPLNLLRIFEEGLRSEILIHPDAMRLVTASLNLIDDKMRADPEANRIFLSLLLDYGNPERALRRMNELDLLGAFIPDFQRIVAMMQFNMYHHYTVDEHTIQCISNLSRIEHRDLVEELPVASDILEKGVNRRVLYVALMLHDIGKGLPQAHEIIGAEIAEALAPRLGLDPGECETVVWLVRNHLLMSDVAQKRDLSDPRTVRDFTRNVKTTSRLNLLTVLTVCDIRGVGPGTWNNWKAQLIRTLYKSTRLMLQEGIEENGSLRREDEAKAALTKALTSWSKEKIQAELDRHYGPFWVGLNTETQQVFARLLRTIQEDQIASDIKPDKDRDATRACFVLADHPGIFSRLAGALALVGANVVDARTYTSSDGYVTAVFWIQDAKGRPYEKSRLTRLRSMISKTLKGEVVAREALKDRDKIKKRERDFVVPTEITFDNEGSEIYTIIEVDTRDRPALLYDLTRTLSTANIYIASAVIATYGEQAVDVFYVKDMFGMKLHAQSKRDAIEQKLCEAIKRGAEGALK